MTDRILIKEICAVAGVSTRTVTMWIDKGLLKGFRVPGSKHRRVLRTDWVAFANQYGIPLTQREPVHVKVDQPSAGGAGVRAVDDVRGAVEETQEQPRPDVS